MARKDEFYEQYCTTFNLPLDEIEKRFEEIKKNHPERTYELRYENGLGEDALDGWQVPSVRILCRNERTGLFEEVEGWDAPEYLPKGTTWRPQGKTGHYVPEH